MATGSTINFISGRYYSISAYVSVSCAQSTIKIAKSTTSSYATISGAPVADQLLWPSSANATTPTYTLIKIVFQATTTETKFVGFYASSPSVPGCTSAVYFDDIKIEESISPFPPKTLTSPDGLYIRDVNIVGTLSDPGINTSTYSTTTPGYQDWTSRPKAVQADGEGINIVTTCEGVTLGRGTWKAWVDWDKNGNFSPSEVIYNTTGYRGRARTFGFIIPAGQTPGDYKLRIRVYNNSPESGSPDFTSDQDLASPYYGEAEDYAFTVIPNCSAKITAITPAAVICGTGPATLTATGTNDVTEFRWWDSETGGNLLNTSIASAGLPKTGTYTPTVSATTTFWVEAWNGTCKSVVRTPIKATVKPVATLTISNSNPTVCGENSIIDLSAASTNEQVPLVSEYFNSGLGLFKSVIKLSSTVTAIDNITQWQNKASTWIPNNTNTWKPAISSGFGTNQFAQSITDPNPPHNTPIENYLELTNSVSTVNFVNLYLKLRLYYSRYNDDGVNPNDEYVRITLSTDNGVTFPNVIQTITSDTGFGSNFAELPTIDLSSYIGVGALKIRIEIYSLATGGATGGWRSGGVAVDDIELYGDKPLTNPSFVLSGTPTPVAYTNASCAAGTEYLGGPVSKIWVKPTLPQLELASYSFTATATLSNGCPTSATINVTNQSKVWKGTTSNDWNVSSNWAPSVVPTATDCVIIPTGTTSQIMNAPNALAKNLTVKAPTGNLELQSGFNLKVTDWINVETGATFNVRNSANLVQVNDTPSPANSGSINMDRTATGLHAKDYIYWSTPVENFGVASVSPLTSLSRIYHWTPDYLNGAGYGWGNWFNVNENMTAGKGYIIRVPNGNATFSTTFTGKPQNGVITRAIVRGPNTTPTIFGVNRTITNEDDNWNLVGNPYPSAINAQEFLAANADIAGEINLWTHSTPIAITTSPYYQTFVYNYKSGDYITYNSSGASSGAGTFGGDIGAGQAFFVKMVDGAAGSGSITFNNGMRTNTSNNPYNNGQFYRTSENAPTEPEKNRIWLDLIDSNLNTSRVLVGYIEGATNGKDRMFDATTNYTESLKAFTSIDKDEQIYVIQGKGLPFDATDKISYGIKVPATGTYKIAIAEVDGLFKTEGQKIYIEDLLTNVTQDLTASPYTFTADAGTFKNRFLIKFEDQTLANNDHEFANSVTIFGKQQLTVKSELLNIQNITVYDILGKTLIHAKEVNTKEHHLFNLRNTNSPLLVKVTLENGAVVIKKVIY